MRMYRVIFRIPGHLKIMYMYAPEYFVEQSTYRQKEPFLFTHNVSLKMHIKLY